MMNNTGVDLRSMESQIADLKNQNRQLIDSINTMNQIAHQQALTLEALVSAHDQNNYELIREKLARMSQYRAALSETLSQH